MESFSKLYNDLTTIPAAVYLSTNQVATFVSDDLFLRLKPEPCLIHILEENINQYWNEIEYAFYCQNLQQLLTYRKGPSLGLAHQLMTIQVLCWKFQTDRETLSKLDTFTGVHNMHQERNVGNALYGLSIVGKDNLSMVLRRLILKSNTQVSCWRKP